MMRRILEKAKFIVWMPIVVLLISSALTAVYGTYFFVIMLYHGFTDSMYLNSKIITTEILAIIDIYLLVVIQFIFSVGLYELFIGQLDIPQWLRINNIDQLKAALASVIILFLAIYFAHLVVEAHNMIDLAYGGFGISAVIGVLVFYYKVKTSQD